MDNRGAPGNYTGRLSDPSNTGATEFPHLESDVATLNRVFQQAPPSSDPITETPTAAPPKKRGLRWLLAGLGALGLGGMFLAFRKRKDASKK